LPGYFTKIEVGDPHLIPQTVWEKLPPSERTLLTEHEFSSQEWAPLDRRRFRIEPESYRTELLMANVGALRLSRNAHNRAKETTVRAPRVDGFAISMIERGAGQLILPGADESAIGNATTALIYSVEPGTRLTASDLQSRLILRMPTTLLRRKLEALLDGHQVDSIAFKPMFDQTRGAGATIRRMSDFLFAELEHSDTLLTGPRRSRPASTSLISASTSSECHGRIEPAATLLVAVGRPDCAFAGLILIAVLEGGEAGGVAILAPRGAGVLAVRGRRQRAAHCRPDLSHHLAAAGAAFAQRRFFGAPRCRLVPTHAILAGAAVPGDRPVAGEGGYRRQQRVAQGEQGNCRP